MKAIICFATLLLLAGSACAQPSFLVLNESGAGEMVVVISHPDASGQVVRWHKNIYTKGHVPNFEALRGRLGLGKIRPQVSWINQPIVSWRGRNDGWTSAYDDGSGGCIEIKLKNPPKRIKPTPSEDAQFHKAIAELRGAGKLATQPISKTELKEISEKFREAGL